MAEPVLRTNLTLTGLTRAALKELGSGCMSKGVEIAVMHAINAKRTRGRPVKQDKPVPEKLCALVVGGVEP